MHESVLSLAKLLCRQSGELFDVGSARGEQSGDESASFFSDNVAMGFGNARYQSMRAQQRQFATNRSGSAPQFYSLSLSGEKGRAQIAIAKPINRELAPVDDFQQLGVDLGKGVQGAIASAGAPAA